VLKAVSEGSVLPLLCQAIRCKLFGLGQDQTSHLIFGVAINNTGILFAVEPLLFKVWQIYLKTFTRN
jgi:hypothetical protein